MKGCDYGRIGTPPPPLPPAGTVQRKRRLPTTPRPALDHLITDEWTCDVADPPRFLVWRTQRLM